MINFAKGPGVYALIIKKEKSIGTADMGPENHLLCRFLLVVCQSKAKGKQRIT